jgi:hypothetical protein
MSDARGEVQASIPGLARRAGITIPECEAGLSVLDSPDRFSRSKEHEGRRIAGIDGGWELLNHSKYRALLSADERREYNRKKQADFRAKKKDSVNDMSITVNHNKQCQHISEAEDRSRSQIAEVFNNTSLIESPTKPKAKREIPKIDESKARGTIEEVVAYAVQIGLTKSDGEYMFAKWDENDWTKNEGKEKIKDWRKTLVTWKAGGFMPSQKQSNSFKQSSQPKTFSGHPEAIEIPDLMNPCLLIPDL